VIIWLVCIINNFCVDSIYVMPLLAFGLYWKYMRGNQKVKAIYFLLENISDNDIVFQCSFPAYTHTFYSAQQAS
jgi:hypothetical protein